MCGRGQAWPLPAPARGPRSASGPTARSDCGGTARLGLASRPAHRPRGRGQTGAETSSDSGCVKFPRSGSPAELTDSTGCDLDSAHRAGPASSRAPCSAITPSTGAFPCSCRHGVGQAGIIPAENTAVQRPPLGIHWRATAGNGDMSPGHRQRLFGETALRCPRTPCYSRSVHREHGRTALAALPLCRRIPDASRIAPYIRGPRSHSSRVLRPILDAAPGCPLCSQSLAPAVPATTLV